MKSTMWVLASTVIILAGCSDKEQSVNVEQAEQSVQEESAGMVTDVVVETPADPPAETVILEMEFVETAEGIPTEAIESADDVLEAVREDMSESVAVTASAAGAMLAGETPAETPVSTGAGPAETITAVQEAAVPVDLEQGKKIYSGKCSACHGAGVAGAPKLGDTANWAPRIAQGMEAMTANAINGFQGASGYMPAKGGFTSLTDEEVTAAVAYMASESR